MNFSENSTPQYVGIKAKAETSAISAFALYYSIYA